MLLLMMLSLVAFKGNLQTQEALWDEVKNHVKPEEGFLIVDDSTLDKPYAKEMAFVRRMWSGKHHRIVKGIGLITLIWTDGTTVIPVSYTHLRAHETDSYLVCRLLLEKKKKLPSTTKKKK